MTELKQVEPLLRSGDVEAVRRLLAEHKPSSDVLNQGMFAFGMPPLAACGNVETAQLLIAEGADPKSAGEWWQAGFGVRTVAQDVASFLIQQGAPLSPHAASALGLPDELAAMIQEQPQVVHAKGGDGATPLHFARCVTIADLLIDAGAELDAIDDDHHSTPLQWLVGDAPEVARRLLERGAEPDVFTLAALGEETRLMNLIEHSPEALSFRIGKLPYPPIGHEGLGGTILQWSLGFNSYAHQFAAASGKWPLFEKMYAASDVVTQFLVACVMVQREDAERLKAAHPNIVESLLAEDLELLARYCWETNASVEAVRLMLDVGFPVNFPESSHGYSPLHNAAWGGYANLVELLIERGAEVNAKDPVYKATPFGWALHCCLEDGRHPTGEYGRVVAMLIDAGTVWDPSVYPTGNEQVDAALAPRIE